MSYNYLPLDRKRLNFAQVKNLLDYDQRVSITFDAHERILKCREFIYKQGVNDKKLSERINIAAGYELNGDQQLPEHPYKLIVDSACATGQEMPLDIVKLMLMLKIKSLSYGQSGVDIETVKRLLDMYNGEVYPIVYTQGMGRAILSHLTLPLAGLGEVFYKGEKRQSAEVLKQLDWQPLELEKLEENAMISGSQYLTAPGLYALKKCAQLLKMANIIAALYFKTVSYSPKTLYTKLATIKGSVGQGAAIAAILAHLEEGEGALENEDSKSPYFASAIATVYGATVDAFHFALDVFLKEVNSVTENLLIFPEDELILPVGNANYALAFALDSLTIALTGFANLCEKRIDQLVKQSGQILPFSDGNSTVYNKLKSLYHTACVLGTENKRLSNPASVHTLPENIAGTDASTAMKCLQVVENLEKMLAIELMCATEIMQVNRQIQLSPFLERFVSDFRQQTLRLDKSSASYIGINKAANFIASYME